MRGWARRRSIWLLPFGTSCCAADLAALFAPPHDFGRFGVRLVHDPSQADAIVIAGRVTRALAPHLLQAFRSMPRPARAVAFGTCACSGGAYDTDQVVSADAVIPVDAYVPGCPPEPGSLRTALQQLNWAGS
ncbi:MAG: NADH-quinone oxidoreductase subunit NuoB [Gemmatimonadaceae bacterium]|nr:NADH-quinone oxidoreductase subunit NuoB [Gemmatimonadaceae bacterium]